MWRAVNAAADYGEIANELADAIAATVV